MARTGVGDSSKVEDESPWLWNSHKMYVGIIRLSHEDASPVEACSGSFHPLVTHIYINACTGLLATDQGCSYLLMSTQWAVSPIRHALRSVYWLLAAATITSYSTGGQISF